MSNPRLPNSAGAAPRYCSSAGPGDPGRLPASRMKDRLCLSIEPSGQVLGPARRRTWSGLFPRACAHGAALLSSWQPVTLHSASGSGGSPGEEIQSRRVRQRRNLSVDFRSRISSGLLRNDRRVVATDPKKVGHGEIPLVGSWERVVFSVKVLVFEASFLAEDCPDVPVRVGHKLPQLSREFSGLVVRVIGVGIQLVYRR